MRLSRRATVLAGAALVSGCLGIVERDTATEGAVGDGEFNDWWQRWLDAAFAPYDCPPIKENDFPDDYYSGPLIDAHLHIGPLPLDENELAGEPAALMGKDATIPEIACTLRHEGTIAAMAFFNVWPEAPAPMAEMARRSVAEYPELFVPFIQPPASPYTTVKAPVLREMLALQPNVFEGYGEVGFAGGTEPRNPPPNGPRYRKTFSVAREHDLMVNYHIGEGRIDEMEVALRENPDVVFISHTDDFTPAVERLLSEYSNFYYTIDEIYFIGPISGFMEGERGGKDAFMATLENNFDSLVDDAVAIWSPRVKRNPDKFMWGTDRGDPKWTYDRDLGLALAKLGRAIIGRFDPDSQEKVAYKNAQRLIEDNDENG